MLLLAFFVKDAALRIQRGRDQRHFDGATEEASRSVTGGQAYTQAAFIAHCAMRND